MDTLTLLHQGLLFAHVVAFAIAFSAVAREDLALLRSGRVDLARLGATAQTLMLALFVLWVTGLALLSFDVGPDLREFIAHPKAVAKLLIVTALTANGLALHAVGLPMLRRSGGRCVGVVPLILGAISSASWIGAAFTGVAREVAPAMSLADFVALYALLLTASLGIALLVVRPRIERISPSPCTEISS